MNVIINTQYQGLGNAAHTIQFWQSYIFSIIMDRYEIKGLKVEYYDLDILKVIFHACIYVISGLELQVWENMNFPHFPQ